VRPRGRSPAEIVQGSRRCVSEKLHRDCLGTKDSNTFDPYDDDNDGDVPVATTFIKRWLSSPTATESVSLDIADDGRRMEGTANGGRARNDPTTDDVQNRNGKDNGSVTATTTASFEEREYSPTTVVIDDSQMDVQ
jgi:hypothetical protein